MALRAIIGKLQGLVVGVRGIVIIIGVTAKASVRGVVVVAVVTGSTIVSDGGMRPI